MAECDKNKGVVVTPQICLKCFRACKQIKELLQKLDTGDKDLDQFIGDRSLDLIPHWIHAYYGCEPCPPEEHEDSQTYIT